MSQNTNFIVGIGGPDLGTVIENVQFKSLKINTSHSIAIGNLIPASTTQGVKSILIGNSAGITSAQGNFAIAIGDYAGNTNQGTNAIAIGSNAGQTNQGPNSIAIGSNSSVTGTSSVAIGYNATTSTYNNSVALGTGATSTADNQIRLGTASQNVSILGNVGIGTQTPQFPLDVNGDTRISGNCFVNGSTERLPYVVARGSTVVVANNVLKTIVTVPVPTGYSSIVFNACNGDQNANPGVMITTSVKLPSSGSCDCAVLFSSVTNTNIRINYIAYAI